MDVTDGIRQHRSSPGPLDGGFLRGGPPRAIPVAVHLAILLAACSDSPPAPACGPAVLTFTDASPVVIEQAGQTLGLGVEAVDGCGNVQPAAGVSWTSSNPAVVAVDQSGTVTAHTTGVVTVFAAHAGRVLEQQVVVRNYENGGSFQPLGFAAFGGTRLTDLWMVGDRVLTGSGFLGSISCPGAPDCEQAARLWDLTDPVAPVIQDSAVISAALLNDVKISADGATGIVTMEAATGGVTLLDLSVSGSVAIHSTFTEGLEPGVHNAWLEEISGTLYAFLARDGADASAGLHVLDLSDPANPFRVSTFYAGSSSLHDVYVRDGLAFLSHWDAGLVILDVGDGRAGGSPSNPVEVSRIEIPGGKTHNAWYWPNRGLVFVGQEHFSAPEDPPETAGSVFVIEASNLADPQIVATWTVGELAPHNFWLDEVGAVLFVAWYGNGIRALDVSGSLAGALELQGLELAAITDVGPRGRAWFWAPQLHQGRVYAVGRQGLWVFGFARTGA